tara:strand:+ start:1377 stop:1613 length:237 start_codon:yes stop_codon:yes gene_type:complete
MKEKIKLNNTEDIIKKIYITNAYSPEKADDLIYKAIHKEGKLVFGQISKNYEKECREYIKMNKLLLKQNNEYCLDFKI